MIWAARVCGYFGVAAIAVLSLVPGSGRPHLMAVSQIEHVIAYCATAMMLALGHPGRRAPPAIVGLLTVYAALLEVAQLFVPGRTARLIDVAAGALGTAIGIGLALLLRRARHAIVKGRPTGARSL
jgi:VanZ family protein